MFRCGLAIPGRSGWGRGAHPSVSVLAQAWGERRDQGPGVQRKACPKCGQGKAEGKQGAMWMLGPSADTLNKCQVGG